MPLNPANIKPYLTIKTGSAGFSVAQGNPNNSLGKWLSTTQLVNDSLHNLFDLTTEDQNVNSVVKYRSLAFVNDDPTFDAFGMKLWIEDPAGGCVYTMAIDPTAHSAKASGTAQGLEIATESAPGSTITALTFTAPTTAETALVMGDLPPGRVRLLIIKQAAQNSSSVSSEQVVIRWRAGSL